jgi:hypothetical protein
MPSIGVIFPGIILLGIMLPLLIALLAFGFGARKGYALHGATLKPIFLPQSFDDTIKYIRDRQDRAQHAEPEQMDMRSGAKSPPESEHVEDSP